MRGIVELKLEVGGDVAGAVFVVEEDAVVEGYGEGAVCFAGDGGDGAGCGGGGRGGGFDGGDEAGFAGCFGGDDCGCDVGCLDLAVVDFGHGHPECVSRGRVLGLCLRHGRLTWLWPLLVLDGSRLAWKLERCGPGPQLEAGDL